MDFDEIVKLLNDKIQELGLITIGEAATLKKTTRSAITQLIQRGRLKTKTVVGKQLVYRDEVENFRNQKPGPVLGTIFKR